jgi:hypothetical protein
MLGNNCFLTPQRAFYIASSETYDLMATFRSLGTIAVVGQEYILTMQV